MFVYLLLSFPYIFPKAKTSYKLSFINSKQTKLQGSFLPQKKGWLPKTTEAKRILNKETNNDKNKR